jgi:hypothetical protein
LSVVPANATAATSGDVFFGTTGTVTKTTNVLVGVEATAAISQTWTSPASSIAAVVLTPTCVKPAIGALAAAATCAAASITYATAVAGTDVTTGNQTVSSGVLSATSSTAATAAAITNTAKFTPDRPGIYKITFSQTGATTTPTVLWTVIAGYDAGGTTNTNRAIAAEGSNITTGWTGTAGGRATVRVTGFANDTRYYVTVDKGSILSGTEGDAGGVIGSVTNTNGTNTSGGITFATGTIAVLAEFADFMDISVTDTGAATTTVTVSSYAAGTGAATTFVAATVTWGVSAAPSAQYSTLGLNVTNGTAITTAANDTTATTVATTANTQQFNIMVSVKDQYNVAYSGFVLSASMTGPGSLGLDSDQDGTAPSTGRSIKATLADDAGQVSIYGDGTAGTTVVSIVATTAAGVSTVIGSKTVKFAGSASKATVTQNLFVAKAGTQLGSSPATTKVTVAGVATTPALTAEVFDSAGTAVVAGSTVKITSSDSAVIVAGTCVELSVDGDPATAGVQPSPGVFECPVSGAVGAASGKSATITFSVYSSTTGLYSIVATPVTFTIGGSIAKSVISTDKASYTAGEAVNLTATSTDSSGNKAYDGQTPYTSISSNKGFGGTNGGLALTAKEIVNGKYSTTSSTGVASVFAPSTPGSFTITGLYTDAATGTAYSATGTVVDGNAALVTQIDALNAKIVALNALIAKIMKKLGVK